MIVRNILMPFFLLLLSISFIHGQDRGENTLSCLEELAEESVSLFSDRDIYLSGDEIWFKAFVFVEGKLNSQWSKVLYLELFNARQEIFAQEKYLVDQGMASGSIILPGDIQSGQYFLRAYTKYGRNFPSEKHFTKIVSIINPNSEPSAVRLEQQKEKSKDQPNVWFKEESIPLNLSLSKKSFGPREAVKLSINGNTMANLVVSVRKSGTAHSSMEIDDFLNHNPWIGPSLNPPVNTIRDGSAAKKDTADNVFTWIPEIRGMTLSGKVVDENGEAVKDVYCLSSVIGGNTQLHKVKSREDGRFIFSYHHLNGPKDLVVSIQDNPENKQKIIINKDFSTSYPPLKEMPLRYDSARHVVLEELFINQQVNESFVHQWDKRKRQDERESDLFSNLGEPDQRISVQEFIHIPTMLEIFRELVPSVTVRGRSGKRRLNIFHQESFKNFDNPLVLLDNVPVSDIDKLLRIDPVNLDLIEVYDSEYLMGDYSYGGIISIRTNTDNFASYKWTDQSVFLNYRTLKKDSHFQFPDYDIPELLKDRKPDFRSLLYWNPDVKLDKEKKELRFFTCDHISRYEVVVRGYTAEGLPCYGSINFEVTK